MAGLVGRCRGDAGTDFDPILLGTCILSHYSQTVAVSGPLAYVAGSRFDIIDISDPTNPRALGYCQPPDTVNDLAIAAGQAYLACGVRGLVIVDISDPVHPATLGGCDTAGTATGIAVDTETAYVADAEAGLQIIDISNPSHPTYIGSYNTAGVARGVAVAAGYAYVADDTNGLEVIDVRNPAAPREVGHRVSGRCVDVRVSGGLAYIIDEDWWVYGMFPYRVAAGEGLVALSIDETNRLQVVGTYRAAGKDDSVMSRLKVVGTLAGVTGADSSDNWGCKIIDMSDPQCPRRIGGYAAESMVMDMDLAGHLAYVLEAWDSTPSRPGRSRLHIVDIGKPAQPRRLGTYATEWETLSVTADRGIAYVGTGTNDFMRSFSGGEMCIVTQRLEVVDVGDVGRPVWLRNFKASVADLKILGSRAYAAESYRYSGPGVEEGGRVSVLDVSNPLIPRRLTNYETGKGVHSLAVRDGIAYIAVGPDDIHFGPQGSSLQVLDVGGPTPRLLGQQATLDNGRDVALEGNIVYLASMTASWGWGTNGYLETYEVGDPAHPVRLGQYPVASGAQAVSLSGHVACVAAGTAGLLVFDVSNPAAPRQVAEYHARAAVVDVALVGRLGYLAIGGYGVEVISLEDPLQPRRLGGNTAFDAWHLETVAGSLYVAGHADGVNILELLRDIRFGAVSAAGAGVVRFEISAVPDLDAQLQWSIDLSDWRDWQTVHLSQVPTVVADPEAGNWPARFYRALAR